MKKNNKVGFVGLSHLSLSYSLASVKKGYEVVMYDFNDELMNKFRNFKQALVDGDIAKAQAEMKDSLWYRQTTNRADRLIEKMGKSL